MSKGLKLAISIIVPYAAAAIGSSATQSSVTTWYTQLNQPSIAPPNWVFGPVWALLYLLMGVSLYLVWQAPAAARGKRVAVLLFLLQLGLNALWSLIFFGQQQLGWALLEIAVLWLAIVATIVVFRRVSPNAAWLLVPYLLWVSFAAYLNYSYWVIN